MTYWWSSAGTRSWRAICGPFIATIASTSHLAQVADHERHGRDTNRLLITLGARLILLGLAWSWIKRLPLFRLPGDIVIDRPGFKFFFPITPLLLVTEVITNISCLIHKR